MTLTYDAINKEYRRVPSHDVLGRLPHMNDGQDASAPWMLSDHQYSVYEAIGRLIRPRRVLEIGVRFGYALVALVRGHDGIETIEGVDNGGYGIPHWARQTTENLRAAGFRGELRLHNEDSREWFAQQLCEPYDLVHVDGDHSFEIARQDVANSWRGLRTGGVLLVDDYGIPGVNDACKQLLGFERKAAFEFPTHNRLFVAVKG